jgi:hypothetical protein
MRRIIILNLIIMLIFSIFTTSCKKEIQSIQIDESIEHKILNYKLPENLKLSIPIENDVPTYDSREVINDIANTLEEEYSTWVNKFVEEMNIQPDDDFDQIAEEYGFDPYLPYKKFEEYHGFKTLFSKILDEENKWLSSEKPDWDNCPQMHFIDSKFRAIVNSYGEFKVEDKIYHINENGVTYEILYNDFELLVDIRDQNELTKLDYPNLTVYNDETDSKGCYTSGTKTAYYYYSYSGSKRYLRKLTFGWSALINGTMFKSIITSYKNESGSWKNHSPYYISTSLNVKCYKRTNCSYKKSWSGQGGFNYRHSVTVSNGWAFKRYATKHGDMSGYYKVRENSSTLFDSGLTY